MHALLADLHRDHINLSVLLELLDREQALLRTQAPTNFPLLTDIVDYVEKYPDLVHHPRENIIFQVYLSKSREAEDVVHELIDQHRRLTEQTQELHTLLDGLNKGAIFPSETLRQALSEYVVLQRNHLNQEEAQVFKLLDKNLALEDWEHVARSLPAADDPLFGDQTKRQYRALYDAVVAISRGATG